MNTLVKIIFLFIAFSLLFIHPAYGAEKLLWKMRTGDMMTTSHIVYNGYIYIKSDSKYIWIADAKTGVLKKMFEAGKIPDGSPIIEKDTIYVPIKKGNILNISTYDLKTGKLLWKYEMGEYENAYTPAIKDNMIYIPCVKDKGESTIFALSKNTGRLVWKADLEMYISAPCSVSNDAVYISTDDGNLLALSKDTGNLKWNFFTKGGRVNPPETPKGIRACAGIYKDTVYIGSTDTYFYAIDKNTGMERWRFKTGGEIISSPAIEKDTVYIGSKDGYVYALSAENGEVKWKYKAKYSITSSPILSGDELYIGDEGGTIYKLDKKTKRLKWGAYTEKKKAISSSLIIVDGVLYVGDLGGNTFAISLENPNIPDWPMFMYDVSHTGCVCR